MLTLPASGGKGHSVVTATRRVHALERRDRAADTSVVLRWGQGVDEFSALPIGPAVLDAYALRLQPGTDWSRCV